MAQSQQTHSTDRSTPSPTADLTRNRLPTLFEVLSRRTRPPVDLFSFYIFMRDQQRSVDYLDFWLDVAQHMSLCRHFVRELRRSVLIGTPDLSKRNSGQFSNYGGEAVAGPSYDKEKEKELDKEADTMMDAQTSAILRDHQRVEGAGEKATPPALQRRQSYGAPTLLGGSQRIGTDSNSPGHTVTRADIRASAEKILYTFLLAGAEREIVLPANITQDVTTAIEEHGRDDPEVFDVAKDYVFQAMERDAFPHFLRLKALGNLVPATLLMRLGLGLLALFGAFWTGFILIFLDISKLTRCWVILPFFIAIYCLGAYQYSTDPILALLGFSEYTPFNFASIREPYVRKLLAQRAAFALGVIIAITTALCCLFILVPGKRL